MQLKQDQLNKHLSQSLQTLYIISGDDPFLHQQSCDAVRQAAKSHGFNERKVFHLETGFNWGNFSAEFGNLSLFGDKTLIELRLNKSSFDRTGSAEIKAITENLTEDDCLLISMPKLTGSNKRSSWFKALDKAGVSIQIWPLNNRQMQAWVNQYAHEKALAFSPAATQYIVEKNQGNLLAASQEIEKLALQNLEKKTIEVDDLKNLLQQNSQFTVFDLSEAFLAKNKQRAKTILESLKLEGGEPSVILWTLARDLRILQKCQSARQQNSGIDAVLQQQYMPDKQKSVFKTATQQFHPKEVSRLFQHMLEIDKSIKGFSKQNTWLLLERMV